MNNRPGSLDAFHLKSIVLGREVQPKPTNGVMYNPMNFKLNPHDSGRSPAHPGNNRGIRENS
jgi:hypothetical protein